jgi:hypothetical protein
MASEPASDLSNLRSAGIETGPRFVPIVQRPGAFITGGYRERVLAGEHTGEEMNAVVTYQGQEISVNGEVLRVGIVPQERRYAIGKVEGGRAELLPKEEFKHLHAEVYRMTFLINKQPPDDPRLRHIPTAKDFVSCKVDPQDDSKIVPLGTGMAAAGERTHLWDQKQDKMVTLAEATERTAAEEILDLEQRLAKLRGDTREEEILEAPRVQEEASSSEIAHCGKPVKKGYVNQHIAKCNACQEILTEPEGAA